MDGVSINLDHLLSQGETNEDDTTRLGKRTKISNESTSHINDPESSSTNTIENAIIESLEAQRCTTRGEQYGDTLMKIQNHLNSTMKLISWNVQGLKTTATRDPLFDLIRTQNPDIIFLYETKISKDKSRPLISHFQYPNQAFIELIGLSGGLLILWKDGFTCELHDSTYNMFNLIVQHDPSRPEYLLTCMYGYPDFDRKQEQWNYIQQIGRNHYGPWILIGDLNFHLLDDNTISSSSSDGFVNNIVNTCGLEDIGY
ncbi:uncharacterized protein LOC113291607 [Papaver somniferum]|uniref:uncharacterized protein LOC113291607 n=1 Tax=Papaver somniferum TaxID=3469 RepID=UPI000E6FF9B8|nr:uncharacterized protein LOC113291607 [Papaver somniferum]